MEFKVQGLGFKDLAVQGLSSVGFRAVAKGCSTEASLDLFSRSLGFRIPGFGIYKPCLNLPKHVFFFVSSYCKP